MNDFNFVNFLTVKKIRTFNIDKMWGIGTPEDLNYFLEKYNK
jgi:hypothetical protein